MLGAGFLGTLLPLRFSALGLSDGVIGLIAPPKPWISGGVPVRPPG